MDGRFYLGVSGRRAVGVNEKLVVVRGAGDLATGILFTLRQFGYRAVALECASPAAIRRTVSFSDAVYDGSHTVEGVTAVCCGGPDGIPSVLAQGRIPVLVDPEGRWIRSLAPHAVVDAILAKKNLGTRRDMAPAVVGVGPGFCAGEDVHAVVETLRGHDLGRFILQGCAQPNTGIPGSVGGCAGERVLYAPKAGVIRNVMRIGQHVGKGDVIATLGDTPVVSKISGVLRGLIRDGYAAARGQKIADVDPRDVPAYCHTISDKARLVGFGAVAAIHILLKREGLC